MAGDLAKRIGFSFSDAGLLKRALTHRSAGAENNERLEFLGDSIVNMIVADALYKRFSDQNEGVLSRLRASLVCEPSLAQLARKIRLGDALLLGAGEKKNHGNRKDSILSDAFEALIGAIYLDGGFNAAKAFVLNQFEEKLNRPSDEIFAKDAKSRLQELIQKRFHEVPHYEMKNISGKPHQQRFEVSCRIAALECEFSGSGNSRRGAEQDAASAALEALQDHV